MSRLRIAALVLKELREFRRNRSIVTTMALLPLVFLVAPTITLLRIPASASDAIVQRQVGVTSLLLLVVPTVIPPVISAYSVIGERDQGTLEPLLTTPVRRDEILLGKALAAFVPSVIVAYAIDGLFALVVGLGGTSAVRAAWDAPVVLAQLLFTPLLAAWAIWVGIGMSARSRDVRVAQQLATLASLPALGVTSLLSFRVITPSVALATGLAFALLAVDLVAWRVVARMFDRERLIAGASAGRGGRRGGHRIA